MNSPDLWYMFETHTGRRIDKWAHYFPIYERHFARFRNKSPRVLELGIDHGGSLQLWKRYFGPGAEIIGIDINSETMFEEPQIQTYCLDQCDSHIIDLGPFDIVIDDGSHIGEHQRQSWEHLWGCTRGVYLIEDCHQGYPKLHYPELTYPYSWVVVLEKPERIIRGEPSRKLRLDEIEATARYGR